MERAGYALAIGGYSLGYLILLILLSSFIWVPLSGRFRFCYEATFVGATGYNLVVEEKPSLARREPHTTASSWNMTKIGNWKQGDELLVCNAIVTNKTKNESATCGDFGCLALWP